MLPFDGAAVLGTGGGAMLALVWTIELGRGFVFEVTPPTLPIVGLIDEVVVLGLEDDWSERR